MSAIRNITGTGIPVRGNDIDTDRIIPARYLKEITFSRMGDYPFYDERFDQDGNQKDHPFNDDRYSDASILLVNKNFGCGSSREHAPQALMRYGITAIVGESFAAIFQNNCLMLGIPVVMVSEADVSAIMSAVEENPAVHLLLDLEARKLVVSNGDREEFAVRIDDNSRTALLEGTWDSTALLLNNMEKVTERAQALPYMAGFSG